MTYCVGLMLDRGLVFISDTRTNSGVIVPNYIGGKRENTGRAEVSDSELAEQK